MNGIRSLLAALGVALMLMTPALAQADSEAASVVKVWIDTVASGDSERISDSLAPEFQIQRADGSAHGKADYVAGGFARISQVLDIDDVVATRSDNLMVVRYVLVVTETIDGRPAEQRAPRLTVFRRDGGRWLVAAHANFARVGK